jgi:hypothetical protein
MVPALALPFVWRTLWTMCRGTHRGTVQDSQLRRFNLQSLSFKVMQELLRHSSFRSTLDVYTQAISPAKHAAQAAVLALVFTAETGTTGLA